VASAKATADQTEAGTGADWRASAEALAAWTWGQLVNRVDVWGGYRPLQDVGKEYLKPDGTIGKLGPQTTRPLPSRRGKEVLAPAILARHFAGWCRADLVGLHSTSPDNTSRWGTIDIDKHGGGGNTEANHRAALAWYDKQIGLGLRPLLTDSNGRGGFHLWTVFREPVPTARVFVFLKWLTADYAAHGMTALPETFPKQANIQLGRFGNWLRLFGLHHRHPHWSRVWDGRRWLEGAEAVACLLALRGDAPGLIPSDLPPVAAPASPATRRPPFVGPFGHDCLLVRRVRAYLARLPHRAEGEHRDDIAYGFACWLVRDLRLPDDVALTWLSAWDAGNQPPKGEARLREILTSAHLYGTRPYGCGLAFAPPSKRHKRYDQSHIRFAVEL
jgi:hypothetical protein